MQEDKNKVEAILFTTGRFMDVDEIAKFCEIGSLGYIKQVLEELSKDYEKRNGALELINENAKWKLNINKQYNYLTTSLLENTEMDKPTQETLAVIAFKNPVLQCDIIKIRGNGAYDHIKYLTDNGFLMSERKGRTRVLKLTQKFFDYFDVVEEKLHEDFEQIRQIIRDYKDENPSNIQKEVEDNSVVENENKD